MSGYRIKYQTYEFDQRDLHVISLRDTNEFFDPYSAAEKLGINSTLWSLFGVVWPSSVVLAKFLEIYPLKNKRILEVGCGIGLASLAMNQCHMDITATDYHPEVEVFLERNTRLNGNRLIPFVLANWKDKNNKLGQFDLIVGSDLLYEDGHVEQLSAFINRHARLNCEIILVDPGRSRQGQMNRAMQALGFSHKEVKPDTSEYLEKPYNGKILLFERGIID